MSRIYYKNYKGITLSARKLRREATSAEISLWNLIRSRNLDGFKFLRQHPIIFRIDKNWVEFFITDFYCPELRLIIELDGPIHKYQIENDQQRDDKLKSRGFFIIRIKNEELSNSIELIEKLRNYMYELKTGPL